MFELASILGDSIESLLNHLTTQNGTYLSQYSAGQPAFGRKETLLVGCYRPKAAARISLQKLGSSLDEEIEPC
jgi:hypothetical protein